MLKFIRQLFCRHNKDVEVLTWHWTHGRDGFEPLFIKARMQCNICGKTYFMEVRDRHVCDMFAEKHKNKCCRRV